ncbi:MAG: serine protease [Alphaproteobacteria bacterium]|nr:serine protease [Alphaproteobacteria bacterium]
MAKSDWEIPANLRPEPDDYRFDLARALRSVVGVRANVPHDAFTASALGTERIGNGTVIRDDGLVLTIGYLITEAEMVWLIGADGAAVPGHALAYDQATGFGLVQALGRLNLPALEFGDSDRLGLGEAVILAAGGGPDRAIEAKVIGRQEFAGYWEYVLGEAIYTAPAHPFWSGSALIGTDGRLLGVGSLILQQGDGRGRRHDMNMIVPIGLLPPILDDLLTIGRVNAPPRPWLGAYVMDSDEGLTVGGLANGSPAERAGLRPGDRIVAFEEEEVGDLATLWRRLWASGPAGTPVKLLLAREGSEIPLRVATADRTRFLRSPRLH